MIHNININNYSIEPSEIEGGTSGSFGNEQLSFNFSQEWNGLSKSVTFYPPRSKPVYVLLTDNIIDIPPEATERSGKTVFVVEGFEVVEDDLKRVLRSVTGTVNVISTLKGEGTESRQPTPTELQQLIAALNGKQDKLIAGANIQITGNIISATGGGGGGTDILVVHINYDGESVAVDTDNATMSAFAAAKKPVYAFVNFVSGVGNYPIPLADYEENDDAFVYSFSGNVYATTMVGYLYYIKESEEWYVDTSEIFTMDYTTNIDEDSTHNEYPTAKAVYDFASGKQDALTAGSGINITNNVISATGGGGVFIAEYGTTTYAQVKAAYDAGKAILCVKRSGSTSSSDVILYCVRLFKGSSGENVFDFWGEGSNLNYFHYTQLTSQYGWTAFNDYRIVDGTYDGTNWKTLTIGSVTKNIPSGGGNLVTVTTDDDYETVSGYLSAGKTVVLRHQTADWTMTGWDELMGDVIFTTSRNGVIGQARLSPNGWSFENVVLAEYKTFSGSIDQSVKAISLFSGGTYYTVADITSAFNSRYDKTVIKLTNMSGRLSIEGCGFVDSTHTHILSSTVWLDGAKYRIDGNYLNTASTLYLVKEVCEDRTFSYRGTQDKSALWSWCETECAKYPGKLRVGLGSDGSFTRYGEYTFGERIEDVQGTTFEYDFYRLDNSGKRWIFTIDKSLDVVHQKVDT